MSVISNNTTFKEFRNRCEDKNALANAGDIYVGTGNKSTEVSTVYMTEGKNIQTAIAEDINRTKKVSFSLMPPGNNSIAIGYFANASGDWATALGQSAFSTGNISVSVGYGANASSIASTAIGTSAEASGNNSIALGIKSKSTGNYSVAIGGANSGSLNEYAIAIGYNASNQIASPNSIALGRDVMTQGNASIAIGLSANSSGDYAISIGNGANALLESVAIGDMAYAELGGAVAVGTKAKVSRGSSVGIGLGADVLGIYSIAIGYNSSAITDGSIAIGSNASLKGSNSIAIGNGASTGWPTVAELRAVNSIAIGYNSSADFAGSIAIGPNAFAGWGNYSVAIGYNALAKAPKGSNVNGSTAIGVGANASERAIVITGRDAIAYISNKGSAWAYDSDERIKENIELGDTSLCLKNINNVPVKRYTFKNFACRYADQHQLGFIAQDLERVYPKLVFTRSVEEFDNPDNPSEKIKIENFKSIEREPLIPVLWGGVQELSKIINEMQSRISELEKEISKIKA